MGDAKEKADRLFKLMRSITFDKNDAKDCAVICAQEMISVDGSIQQGEAGAEEYYQKVIEEIKKI